MVYEGEHALAVMARDELHWYTDTVDVCVAWATSHLKGKKDGTHFEIKTS